MEILRRGHGHFGRKRKLVVDDYDTLHTDLAKRMREYSEHGTDAIRFLLDVMSHEDPDEPYTWHHRVSAAQELIRRGWDTNYDRITPEMLQAYWRNQQSSRLSVGQKKHLASLPTTLGDYNQYDNKDYQAIADAIREQEDREAAEGSKFLPPRRGKVRMGVKSPESNLLANPSERESGNPARQGEETQNSILETRNSKLQTDNSPDCYHEPLATPTNRQSSTTRRKSTPANTKKAKSQSANRPRKTGKHTNTALAAHHRDRRSRRRPPPTQPPSRHPPPPQHPQPLRKVPSPRGRGLG